MFLKLKYFDFDSFCSLSKWQLHCGVFFFLFFHRNIFFYFLFITSHTKLTKYIYKKTALNQMTFKMFAAVISSIVQQMRIFCTNGWFLLYCSHSYFFLFFCHISFIHVLLWYIIFTQSTAVVGSERNMSVIRVIFFSESFSRF